MHDESVPLMPARQGGRKARRPPPKFSGGPSMYSPVHQEESKMNPYRVLSTLFVTLALALASLSVSACSSPGDTTNSSSSGGSGGSGGY